MAKYKVLSLWQPWAQLIVLGEKRIETRSWYFSHRGPLLIHAAKRFTKDEYMICLSDPFRVALARHRFNQNNLPLGAIVGKVNVVDCRPTYDAYFETLEFEEEMFGNYEPGRYGIICDLPILFDEPISTRGFQGLWDYDLPEVA